MATIERVYRTEGNQNSGYLTRGFDIIDFSFSSRAELKEWITQVWEEDECSLNAQQELVAMYNKGLLTAHKEVFVGFFKQTRKGFKKC